MDADELDGYAERSRRIADDAPQMDEANTKKRLVEPFIEDVLGWDGFSDVELEYSVQMGRNPKKVDYALLLEGTPVVFVEAKGLDESLSETEESQLRSYMRQVGVDWGVLTNGERFKFLKRVKDADRPKEVTFGNLGLDQLADNEEVVRTVSKPSVESGESERIADEIQRRRRAVSSLRREKEAIAEEVVGVVTDRVGESVASVAETEAKEFVDRVVEELENGKRNVKAKKNENETERDDIILTAGETVVSSFDSGTQAEMMVDVVEYLISKHELLKYIELPWVPGDKWAILNDVPEHPNGEEMRGTKALYEDYYLETNLNKSQKERYLSKLSGKCGLGVDFNW